MKTKFLKNGLAVVLIAAAALAALGAGGPSIPSRPATQAEVNAGVEARAYVTPATLAGLVGGGGGSSSSGAAAGGVAYVATTGSDGAAGTLSAPFLTMTNALARLHGSGTIIVRGGNYFNAGLGNLTNVGTLAVRNYRGEVPRFYFGQNIAPGSFSILTQGVYQATMTTTFSNALHYLTNKWDAWSPSGRSILLYQTNTPFGPQSVDNLYIPIPRREGTTNRCEHYPLVRAASLAAMSGTTGRWFAAGSTLYVTFASTNQAGGIYLPSTNTTDTFFYGGTDATEVSVRGIRSYFGSSGFDVSTVGQAQFFSCGAVGAGQSGFYAAAGFNGSLRLFNCEGEICELAGLEVGSGSDGIVAAPFSDVLEVGCVWHDNLREASSLRGNTSRVMIGATAFGNLGQYGIIDDGSASTIVGSTSVSNLTAGYQVGNAALFTRSFQRQIASRSQLDSSGVNVDDKYVIDWSQGFVFDTYGVPINITANPTLHYVRESGGMIAGQGGNLNSPVIQGGGTPAANFVEDVAAFGSVAYVNGNSFLQASGATPTFGMALNVTSGYINLPATTIKQGTGSPEGAVSAPVGSLYFRSDGSGTTYTKTNGTGNTGWYDNLLRTHG